MDTLLAKVKTALRIVTEDFDDELTDLISAALKDMNLAGVSETELTDVLIIRAVITYCKMNFGEPDQYERLKKSYDEQKAQLGMATGYTTWSA
jgi:hypothetical protein